MEGCSFVLALFLQIILLIVCVDGLPKARLAVKHQTSAAFPPVEELCQMPQEVGMCDDFQRKWFYDAKLKRCRTFVWSGCGGNVNNFRSRVQCENTCAKPMLGFPAVTVKPTTRLAKTKKPHIKTVKSTARPLRTTPRLAKTTSHLSTTRTQPVTAATTYPATATTKLPTTVTSPSTTTTTNLPSTISHLPTKTSHKPTTTTTDPATTSNTSVKKCAGVVSKCLDGCQPKEELIRYEDPLGCQLCECKNQTNASIGVDLKSQYNTETSIPAETNTQVDEKALPTRPFQPSLEFVPTEKDQVSEQNSRFGEQNVGHEKQMSALTNKNELKLQTAEHTITETDFGALETKNDLIAHSRGVIRDKNTESRNNEKTTGQTRTTTTTTSATTSVGTTGSKNNHNQRASSEADDANKINSAVTSSSRDLSYSPAAKLNPAQQLQLVFGNRKPTCDERSRNCRNSCVLKKHVTDENGCQVCKCDDPEVPSKNFRLLLVDDYVIKSRSRPCSLPAYHGPCSMELTRWRYNPAANSCETFEYGGCRGNENNFGTEASCLDYCQAVPDDSRTQKQAWYRSVLGL